MKVKMISISLLVSGMIAGRKEGDVRAPYGIEDTTSPQEVTNMTVKNMTGGVVIKYDVPPDPDLMYAKTSFKFKKGEIREVRSPMYTDLLIIKGIGDTNEHNVTVHVIDRADNASKGISVSIHPETPPVIKIREPSVAERDWRRFSLAFENKEKEPISIMAYYESEETKGSVLHDIYYMEQATGPSAIRRLSTLPSHFSVIVRDRQKNESEPYILELTSLKEGSPDSSRFKEMFILGDARWTFFGGGWDRFPSDNYGVGDFAHTDYPILFPHPVIIDMGVTVVLSRMKIWQRLHEDDFYKYTCPRHFKVYGYPENLSPSKEKSYVLLMDGHSERPPGGDFTDPNTAEDTLAAKEGHEFLLENDSMSPVRYVCLVFLESWSGMECTYISEMKFWG